MVIVSEYGITAVLDSAHLNGALLKNGLISVRQEVGHELLDAGASRAFAVADHQVAHVYVNDPTVMQKVRDILEKTSGVAQILHATGKQEARIDDPRAGEFVVIAEPDAWFTYYYWLDDHLAPDYARTVDIHRKPGYDPVDHFYPTNNAKSSGKDRLDVAQIAAGFSLFNGCDSSACFLRAWLTWSVKCFPGG